MNWLSPLSSWAWHASLEALPLAFVMVLLWRWRAVPVMWRWWVPALFFLRLAMPQVPAVDWHWWSLAPAPQSAAAVVSSEPVAVVAPAWRFVDLLPLVWLLGCAAVLGWLLLSQWRLARSIRRNAQPAVEELRRLCDWAAARMALSQRIEPRVVPGADTLAIFGFWRPVLLVPHDLEARFSSAQIRGMLLHEMAHVRRRDVLWTWLALGMCAVHWFNPLAWLALRRFHADRELACDAAALAALDASARRNYGEAILLCLQGPAPRMAPALAPFFHHLPELKQRLQNIMNPTTSTPWSRIVTTLLVPALVLTTFTASRADNETEKPKPSPESAERPRRDGEAKREGPRDGETKREGARDGDGKAKAGPRDGEGKAKAAPRDGEQPREGVKEGARDGEQPRKALREGERREGGAKDGDGPRKGPRDGDRPKEGARDGDRPKEGLREGDRPKEGARDGERPRNGARDGEAKKGGERDGEQPRRSQRDGDAAKPAPREGDAAKPAPKEGEKEAR